MRKYTLCILITFNTPNEYYEHNGNPYTNYRNTLCEKTVTL